jgi:multidrug efflux pump
MQVQNKLQLVTRAIAADGAEQGITVAKSTSNGFLMVVGFVSTDGKHVATDLADYVDSAR